MTEYIEAHTIEYLANNFSASELLENRIKRVDIVLSDGEHKKSLGIEIDENLNITRDHGDDTKKEKINETIAMQSLTNMWALIVNHEHFLTATITKF